MPRPTTANPTARLALVATIAVVVASLYLAREVLIPLALATILTFVLAPMVRRLENVGLHRVPAVIAAVGGVLLIFAAVGYSVAVQAIDLVESMPLYRSNIQEKVSALSGTAGHAADKIADTVSDVLKPATIDEAQEAEGAIEPVPVTVVEKPPSAMDVLRAWLGPLVPGLVTGGIVLVFVIFMLLQREDMRDRLIKLISRGNITVTTQALDEVGKRVSRYLLMQLVINITYGVALAIGLSVIGVPNAVLWGSLGVVLRFIPYAGAIIAGGFPVVLSMAVSDGWTLFLTTLGFVVVLELFINNVLEVWLYSRGSGLSTVAVLLALVFWTWLWGLPGLLLATPMTACLVVAGRYVPQLSFLNVMLGDEPVLAPPMRLYQRLLAGDTDEAGEIAEAFAIEQSFEALCDDLLIPVLRMAEADFEAGTLGGVKLETVHQTIREMAMDFAEQHAPLSAPAPGAQSWRVLVVPARDEADAVAAVLCGLVLTRRGNTVRVLSLADLGTDANAIVREFAPDLAVVSAVPPHAVTPARLRTRAISRKWSDAAILAGVWGLRDGERVRERLIAAGAQTVATSLRQAADQAGTTIRAVRRAAPEAKNGGPGVSAGAAGGAEAGVTAEG